MDKIEKIKEWVKKRKKEELARNSIGVITGKALFVDANELLSFLDTLSEEPDNDLEEAARNNADSTVVDTRIEYCGATEDVYFYNKLIEAFYEGANWERQGIHQEIDLAKDSWYQQGVIDGKFKGLTDDEKYQQGRFDMKEQMMKEAVEGEIVDSGFDDGTAILKAIVPDRGYDSGDKVKLIVIKED